MKRLSTAILAIGIAVVFVLYMVTYTVSYNQIAIIKTFERAADPDPTLLEDGKDTGSVIQEPGLKWKWPWPIQSVQTYPTQLQVLQDTPEQLGLKDNNTIIINLALTWRIKDPLAFSITLGSVENAEEKLLSYMRDLRSVISTNYGFDDLVNEDPSKVKLAELEAIVAERLSQQLNPTKEEETKEDGVEGDEADDSERKDLNFGIEIVEVTVGQLLYAQSTAESVNTAMSSRQNRKAEEVRNQGTSQAAAIVSEANSISEQLKYFADTVATQIEIIGINEANAFLARYSEVGANEDLAIYLRQLEAIKTILANRTTFVLDARTFSPLDVLVYGHGGTDNLSRLFAQPNQSTAFPAAPLSPQAQAQALRDQIQTLEQQILKLNAEVNALETRPPFRQSMNTHTATEPRP